MAQSSHWHKTRTPPIVQHTRNLMPSRVPKRYDYVKVRAVADANPGQWVVVARRGGYSLAKHIREGTLKAFRDAQDKYEVVVDKCHGYDTYEVDVYVRRKLDD